MVRLRIDNFFYKCQLMPAPFFGKYNSCFALVVFSSLGLAFVTLKKIIDNKRTTYYIIPDNKTLTKSNFTFIFAN
jgi:hypothetical protein